MSDKKSNFYSKLFNMRNIFKKNKNNDLYKERGFDNDTKLNYIITGIDEKGKTISRTIANDAAYAPIYTDQFYIQSTNQLLIDNVFMGYAEMAALSQNGMLKHISDTLSGDMTRKGFRIVDKDKVVDINNNKVNDSNSDEKIKLIEAKFKALKITKNLKKALSDMFIYGGSMIYIKMDNANKVENGTYEHENELILDEFNVKRNSLEYIKEIEPLYAYPVMWIADDPTDYNYYNPVYYTIMGKTYHRSRLLKFLQFEAQDIYKPTYNFFGIPLLQLCIPYARDFEKIRNNVANIVERFNLSVLGVNMENSIDVSLDDDIQVQQSLKNRIETFNDGRNNFNTLIIDKENESFEQIQIPLQNLDVLLNQSLGFLATISQVPKTKLFGDSPTGMNATGEYDLKNYCNNINTLQNQILLDNLTTLLQIIQLDLFGVIDENLVIEFETLYDANDLELSQINLNDANTLATLVTAEILSKNEALNQVTKSETFKFKDIELPDDMSNDNYEEAYDE